MNPNESPGSRLDAGSAGALLLAIIAVLLALGEARLQIADVVFHQAIGEIGVARLNGIMNDRMALADVRERIDRGLQPGDVLRRDLEHRLRQHVKDGVSRGARKSTRLNSS